MPKPRRSSPNASAFARWKPRQLSFVQPGEMQPERDFNYQSQPDRQAQRTAGRGNRGGPGWFSFDMTVDPASPMALIVTFYNELGLGPANGNFDILVDGTSIAKFSPTATASGFYDAQYAIPANLIAGKSREPPGPPYVGRASVK